MQQHTPWLTPWSSVLPEKLTVAHPVRIFIIVYGSRKFMPVFTKINQLTLPPATVGQSTYYHDVSLKPILKLLWSLLFRRT
jgi:hypothetical protein